jgi:hypothetical protein
MNYNSLGTDLEFHPILMKVVKNFILPWIEILIRFSFSGSRHDPGRGISSEVRIGNGYMTMQLK